MYVELTPVLLYREERVREDKNDSFYKDLVDGEVEKLVKMDKVKTFILLNTVF